MSNLDKEKFKDYNWKIGRYIFEIYTTESNLEIPFRTRILNEGTSDIPIRIWINKNQKDKDEILEFCKNKAKKYIPKEIEYFYNAINSSCKKKYSIFEHMNCYYKYKENKYAYFPYFSDNFIIKYSDNSNDIFLYGSKENLYRVILDFLTVEQNYLPLHASAVYKGNKIISLVSDSGCGKTSILIKLLQKGYTFIGDDSLFANQNNIFPISNMITVRKDFPNHPKIEKIVNRNKMDKIAINIEQISKSYISSKPEPFSNVQFYYLHKKGTNWRGLKQMAEPFPSIFHHSFWCANYILKGNGKKAIQDKVEKSVGFWEEKLTKIKPIEVDMNNFENFINDFENKIK